MNASPLAFLRGAAPLFYEILRARPALATGPSGEGWLVGDMHLENFGAYRPDPMKHESERVVEFDLNDFDDAVVGPWSLDVLRLTTSVLLAGRELGATGIVALDFADRLLEAWARSAFDGKKPPPPPAPVLALMDRTRKRSMRDLLEGRTERTHGKHRRFVRGARYADLPADIVAAVPKAFETYAQSLQHRDEPPGGSFEVVDCALRIAGTGSLGGLRIGVLVVGKGGADGGYIFDMKEQGAPSAATFGTVSVPPMKDAERVCTAFHACIATPPRLLGSTTLRTSARGRAISMFVRKLTPQEDKLDLGHIDPRSLPALASYLGAKLGAAHMRGQSRAPKKWSLSDLATLRSHAVTIAGIHESVYLELCERTRALLVPKR